VTRQYEFNVNSLPPRIHSVRVQVYVVSNPVRIKLLGCDGMEMLRWYQTIDNMLDVIHLDPPINGVNLSKIEVEMPVCADVLVEFNHPESEKVVPFCCSDYWEKILI
jgi:hypothetical protein